MGNIARVIAIAVGLVLMVGFGLCGVTGLVSAFEGSGEEVPSRLFVMLGLTGLAIAGLIGWGVWRTIAKMRKPPAP